MAPITTVIITKNEAKNIEACIRSAQSVSDDVVVVDCGSSDETTSLAEACGAKVLVVEWQCYGHSRNAGAAVAKFDWILSLDADERVSGSLAKALHSLNLTQKAVVYKIRRKNYFGTRQLRYGTPGFESVVRLYNRQSAQWDLVPVHEKLQSVAFRKKIKQPIDHFAIANIDEHAKKKEHYAHLSAQKYLQQNKKATLVKRFVSPLFNGVKSYVFQLGFLDGRDGWQVAKTTTYYTWLKYKYLRRLAKSAAAETDFSPPASKILVGAPTSFFAKR
jgi:glycosyltransferase involved in cell wall biosynthesis